MYDLIEMEQVIFEELLKMEKDGWLTFNKSIQKEIVARNLLYKIKNASFAAWLRWLKMT